jgi:hypothetical protein
VSFLRAPIVVLALAWLVPGLGHALLGQRWRGAVYFVLIAHLFAIGVALTDGHAVDRREHPVAFYAQVPAGGPTLAKLAWDGRSPSPAALGAARRTALVPYETGDAANDDVQRRGIESLVARLDLGLLYTMIAGLLNFLLAVDAFERAIRRGQEDERAALAADGSAASPGAAS